MESLVQALSNWGIKYKVYEHPPLHDCQEADRLQLNRSGTRIKNLFLRDNYGRRHFLLLVPPERFVDLKALTKHLAVSRLGFASAQRLEKYLLVQPGCVSLLALLNDTQNAVELLIDETIWQADEWQCHPLINTQTFVLSKVNALKFLQHTGHEARVVDLESQTEPS